MRGGVPIVSYLFLRETLADRQITLPAGYMGSGLIGAALISCVSFPHHPSLSFARPYLFAVAKRQMKLINRASTPTPPKSLP
jgi:hypothetical protein